MNVLLTGIVVFSLLIAFTSSQSTAVPSWKVRPQNRTERLGYNASLSCSVDNAAGRWLAWMKIGSDGVTIILFTNTLRFQAPSRYSVASNGDGDSMLYLTSIEKDDDALFQCDLQNSNLSAAAQITVLGKFITLSDYAFRLHFLITLSDYTFRLHFLITPYAVML